MKILIGDILEATPEEYIVMCTTEIPSSEVETYMCPITYEFVSVYNGKKYTMETAHDIEMLGINEYKKLHLTAT